MIQRITLSDEQAQQAITLGAFPPELVGASEQVVIVLTQSWCPQWQFMKTSLNGLGKKIDGMNLTIFTYEYDRSPLFHAFMSFKETTFGNWEVPYLRMYKNGRFVGDGNTMPAGRIIQALKAA